jgi:hypothetical protein
MCVSGRSGSHCKAMARLGCGAPTRVSTRREAASAVCCGVVLLMRATAATASVRGRRLVESVEAAKYLW